MARDLTYEPGEREKTVSGALVRQGDNVVAMPQRIEMNADPIALRESVFATIGTQKLAPRQAKILMAPADAAKEIDILPGGEVYASHVHIRRRLNAAVGPMGWALRPITLIDTKSAENTMFQQYALIVEGRIVAVATGSAKYYTDNKRMDYADTAEAVRSNALTRCSKDLGMFSECWDRQWAEAWRSEFCVHVWVNEYNKQSRKHDLPKAYWRRIDYKPFPREFNIVPTSPNQSEWRKQIGAWIALLEAEKTASAKVAQDLATAKRAAGAASRGADQSVQNARADNEFKPAGSAAGSRSATNHADVDPSDRKYLIGKCLIHSKTASYILHKIIMKNGDEFFTFSTTIYAEMQKIWAAGTGVQIDWRVEKSGAKSFKHIDKWAPVPLNRRREPGQEG